MWKVKQSKESNWTPSFKLGREEWGCSGRRVATLTKHWRER